MIRLGRKHFTNFWEAKPLIKPMFIQLHELY